MKQNNHPLLFILCMFITTNADTLCAPSCPSPITCTDAEPDCLPVLCYGDNACAGLTITCEHSTTHECMVYCGGGSANSGACDTTTVTSNSDTKVICDSDGIDNCKDAIINVQGNANDVTVNVTCAGLDACQNTQVNVYGSGVSNVLTTRCYDVSSLGNGGACTSMDIYCGFDNKQCQVSCDVYNADACNGAANILECPNGGIGTSCTILNHATNPTNNFDYKYTFGPSNPPIKNPSTSPTQFTFNPTTTPSGVPTQSPSVNPSIAPSSSPSSIAPSAAPSQPPSTTPSNNPTQPPSTAPSNAPTWLPSNVPSDSPLQPPTNTPSYSPSKAPSTSPSNVPSNSPSQPPSVSPSVAPSNSPTTPPSTAPSDSPSQPPSNAPSKSPILSPSNAPSNAPSSPPSVSPSSIPTTPPSNNPSNVPSNNPSIAPSNAPSTPPTNSPSTPPSNIPSGSPTQPPTNAPSNNPSFSPSISPSNNPSVAPSNVPSNNPSNAPSDSPSNAPSYMPTPYPTHNAKSRPIISNYVMNNNFGFPFAASINQCMNDGSTSGHYIKYECIDNETAMHTIYDDETCDDDNTQSIVEIEIYNTSNTNDIDYYCGGDQETSNTFVVLDLFPSNTDNICAQSDKFTIYAADGICVEYGNIHYYIYCDEYRASGDGLMKSFAEFYYFDDECSLIGLTQKTLYEQDQDNNQCKQTHLTDKRFFIQVGTCFVMDDVNGTTSIPTKSPTATIQTTIQTTETDDGEDTVTGNKNTRAADISGYIVVGSCLVLPMIFVLVAFMFHRKREGTDRPGYISLFKFFTSVGDFYTDAIFSLTLYGLGNDLWFYAIIFSFGPHVLSIFVGLFYITKWRQTRTKQYISGYAQRFDKLIVILTLVSGFYATTELITSHLFHLEILSLQISTAARSRILNLKIINNVILENTPMIYIQYIFLLQTTNESIFDNGLSITLLAITFSATAILFGVLTVSVRIFNGFIECFRKKSSKIIVRYEIESAKPGIIQKYHVHTKESICESSAKALHIEINQIDVYYIKDITNGIKVKIKFRYLNVNNTDVIANGLLDETSKIFKDHYTEITNALCISSPGIVRINILDVSVLKHDDYEDKETSPSPKYITLTPKKDGETSPSPKPVADKSDNDYEQIKSKTAVSIQMHEMNQPDTLEDYFED